MDTAKGSSVRETANLSSNRSRPRRGEALSTIGDLAKTYGLTLRTLRFYEDRGLLSPFRDGNARLYDEHDKARLALIIRGKRLGFTLGEIRDLIAKGGTGLDETLPLDPRQIEIQIDHLRRQREGIDDAISQLNAARDRLSATL